MGDGKKEEMKDFKKFNGDLTFVEKGLGWKE